MNYHSLTKKTQVIQAFEQDMQVSKYHPFANHSKQAIKIPSTTYELYTAYKRMIHHPTY